MITVSRLQAERQRARAAGARGGRAFDIEAAMAEMREQGFDPHRHGVELIFGPAPAAGADGARLERFVFRVAGSKPRDRGRGGAAARPDPRGPTGRR